MKDYRPQLRRLLQKEAWKKNLYELVIDLLLLRQTAIDRWYYHNFNFLFSRREFVTRTTARLNMRFHWVRVQVEKPHRLAFTLLFIVLLVGLINAPHTQAAMYWSIGWGTVFSIFVTFKSISRILQFAPLTRKKMQP